MNKKLKFFMLLMVLSVTGWGQESGCPVKPVLVANNGELLCAGNPITLTAYATLPEGCQLADSNPYVFSLGGSAIAGTELTPNSIIVNTPQNTNADLLYTVVVNIIDTPDDTDAQCPCIGTSSESEAVIVAPTPNAPFFSPVFPISCPGEVVTITATSANGTDGDFRWYDAAGQFLSDDNPYTTQPLGTNNTILYVSEKLGDCEGPMQEIVVISEDIQNPTVITPPPTCEGDIVEIIVQSGGSNGTIVWYNSAMSTSPIFSGNPFYTPENLVHNNVPYVYWYEEVVGDCVSDRQSVEVTIVANPPIPNLTAPGVCELSTLQLTSHITSGVTYDWVGPDGMFFSNVQNPQIPNADLTDEGIYTLTVTTPEGCVAENSIFAAIYPNPPVSAGMYDPIIEGDILQLQGTGNGNFFWTTDDPTVTFSDPYIPNPTVQPLQAGTYTYTLEVTNEFGCSNTDVTQVIVNESRVLGDPNSGIYNTITPNGDGSNDTWVIPYIENFENYLIQIYDREGVVILDHDSNLGSNLYLNDWNAKYRGRDMPEGVYWYYISIFFENENGTTENQEYKGALFVKR